MRIQRQSAIVTGGGSGLGEVVARAIACDLIRLDGALRKALR